MYSGDEYYDDDITSGVADDGDCVICGESICEHGKCECSGGCCQCLERYFNQQEADREFAFQRDVIGPMFGFDQEAQ